MMKKMIFLAIVVALLAGFQSCKQKQSDNVDAGQSNAIDSAHNSQNSLDWPGTYTGVIPCADCEGIDVHITLNEDGAYQMSYRYIGKKGDSEQFTGTFEWTEDGGSVILSDKTRPYYYKVGENRLFQFDMEGKPITGELADMYVLTKNIEECTVPN
ncbi:copper resistance protein NlpE [Viscerimonas tarda]